MDYVFLRKQPCDNFLYGIFENEINFFTIQEKPSHVSIQLIKCVKTEFQYHILRINLPAFTCYMYNKRHITLQLEYAFV